MAVLIGDNMELSPELRTKEVAVHAGPSQLLVPSKVLMPEEVDNSCPSLNNSSLIAQLAMETMLAKVVSTTMPSDMLMLNH